MDNGINFTPPKAKQKKREANSTDVYLKRIIYQNEEIIGLLRTIAEGKADEK